jgi:hypothetical protein
MSNLKENDLQDFVSELFTIDSYKSKMGKDTDVAVLAFEVRDKEPAKDLMNFIEKGYGFILDADVSSGENKDGKYNVFVEMERNRYLPKNIANILEDISKLTGSDNFKFRYYKGIDSHKFDEKVAEEIIPLDSETYENTINEFNQSELNRFFNKGVTEQRYVKDDIVEFTRHPSGNCRMQIVDEGTTEEIVNNYKGAIQLEDSSMSEVMWMTKFFGNYNIYKMNEQFFFTNGVRTKVMKRV